MPHLALIDLKHFSGSKRTLRMVCLTVAPSWTVRMASDPENPEGADANESHSTEGVTVEALETTPEAAYVPPEWGGIPREVAYSLEIVKDGAALQRKDISKKDHYVIGRIPTADIVVQHPSTSRCHAVVQYNGHSGEAFLYDLGSTHGTFLNKGRLKSHTYAPLRVGDMFKIGASSRLYVFHGPADMMPQEGMNRHQKLMMGKLMEAEKQRERDKQIAAAQMQSAISGGISWGMGEDAVQDDDDEEEVNWKLHILKNKVTEKQQKLVDKIRSRELKVNHLQKEGERIEAKKRVEGSLTPGQAITLARNEQVLERLTEEIEDFEDLLKDSIRESLSAKEKKATDGGKRKKRENESDDDDNSTDEDNFYDRTGHTKKKHGQRCKQDELFTPEALYAKRASLEKSKEDLVKSLIKHQLSGPDSQDADVDDALDSFMQNVEEQLGVDQISSMESQLSDVEKQLVDTNKLLIISDPEGLYNPENIKKQRKGMESNHSIGQSTGKSGGGPEDVLKNPSVTKDSDLMPPPPPVIQCHSEIEGNEKLPLDVTSMCEKDCTTDDLIEENVHGESPSVPGAIRKGQEGGSHGSKAHMNVIADLAILSAATKVKEEVANEDCKDWKPPEGQSGDGLTHLNAKFGY